VVRTIVRELPAGPFALAWDGRADAGTMQPQGRYTFRVTVSKAGLSEIKRFAVVAQAFDIRPSVSTARRGRTLTVTVVTAESLHTVPRLVVRQPGISPFAVTLRRIAPRTYRATFTVRASHTGSMALDVSARDAGGRLQTTRVRLAIR
jgi:hypothetical protein